MDGALWAGLDLGLRRTSVCIVDDSGITVHEETCNTDYRAIDDALSTLGKERIRLIAVEAGSDMHVVRKLRDGKFPVALFEARKASKFLAVRRNKSDVSDAHGLADLARIGRHTVSQVHLKSLDCQQVRSQLVMRHKLVKLRVAADGALQSRLALHGRSVQLSRVPGLMRERVCQLLHQLKEDEHIDLAEDLQPLIDLCESLRSCLQRLDRSLAREALEHPVCRRLMEVTGVGSICSLSFYSAIEDPARFKRNVDVAAYLGLVPRRYQSGGVSLTRGITKTGNRLTRTHLVNAATVFSARGPDSELKAWAATLKQRIGARRARVAVARKLAILLLKLWKEDKPFDPFPTKASGKL